MGLRETNKQDKRERLSRAAHELFSEQGFDATTMRQIAERAGIGVGTIFLYARDKQGLLFLLFSEAVLGVEQQAFATLPTAGTATSGELGQRPRVRPGLSHRRPGQVQREQRPSRSCSTSWCTSFSAFIATTRRTARWPGCSSKSCSFWMVGRRRRRRRQPPGTPTPATEKTCRADHGFIGRMAALVKRGAGPRRASPGLRSAARDPELLFPPIF